MADAPATPRRLNVPILIVGVVIAIAGFAASAYIGRGGTSSGGATKPEVVAAHDLDVRATLVASDLQVVQVDAGSVPPDALTTTSAAVGQVLQVSLKKGQPVLSNLVAKTAADAGQASGFLPVKSGLVADTLPTAELVGVAGYIRSGDYIDVIAVVPSRSGGTANVRTIYSGVHVIKVGASADQSTAGAAATSASLTVAVTECQAEFLNWFLANAALKYTLLSSEDYASAASQPADTSCPANGAKGVSETDIRGRWPGLMP